MEAAAGPEFEGELASVKALLAPVMGVDARHRRLKPMIDLAFTHLTGGLIALAFVDEDLALLHEPNVDLGRVSGRVVSNNKAHVDRTPDKLLNKVTDNQFEERAA